MTSRIPPLLEPYLALPREASLILLTSVLGASSNWLVLRFVYSALLNLETTPDLSPEEDTRVLLVSFMRDLAFWKENGRRLGLDLDKLSTNKRFAFVDGLSGLFLPNQQKSLPQRSGEKILCRPELNAVSKEIQQAIQTLRDGPEGGKKILLVIDHADLLLAASGDQVNEVALGEMLVGLQKHVHSMVLTLSADLPLVAAHQTTLEIDHSALLLSIAHQADLIMSLRLLDSGTARDVSGVVRVTVGDQASDGDQGNQKGIEEKELLYFVGGDGGVRVFERGQ